MSNIETLARQRVALLAEIEAINERIAQIDAAIVDAVEVGGRVEVDGQPVFRVQQRRTFDLERARQILPAELLEAATVTVTDVDAKRLQELLPPALREQCMKPGRISVARATR